MYGITLGDAIFYIMILWFIGSVIYLTFLR